MGELDQLSRTHDLPFYTHMLETKLQRVLSNEQPRFKDRSLVRYAADLGFLSERMNVIHAIWMDDADYDLIAANPRLSATALQTVRPIRPPAPFTPTRILTR